MGITRESLSFVEEAGIHFQENFTSSTYRNKKEEFIALRWGMFNNCMQVYELGSHVGNFDEMFNKPTKEQRVEAIKYELMGLSIKLDIHDMDTIIEALNDSLFIDKSGLKVRLMDK